MVDVRIKKFSYLKYIWHDPNCPAWERNPKTNKNFKYFKKQYPDKPSLWKERKCICGYDKDYKRLRRFIKGDV